MGQDLTVTLQQKLTAAVENRTPLSIQGGNSKAFYGHKSSHEVLNISAHRGIINYQPSELVITARTGTRLTDIEAVLAEQQQMLAFEPPHFGSTATLGGTIACGFSGSRRPFTGSARDFVLGCKIINGKAEVLSFGGEVMKNVAGYDVSRLMTGAMGTLGVLLEISLKVLPMPAAEQTQCLVLDKHRAVQKMLSLSRSSLPISALSYDGKMVYVRFSGGERAVTSSASKVGGELLPQAEQFWQDLKEQRLAFFQNAKSLWRISVPATAEMPAFTNDCYLDWGGALRWLSSEHPAEEIFAAAAAAQGHAWLFRGEAAISERFQPLPEALLQLHKRLKQAFDPFGILNIQRFYKDW